MSFQSNLMRLFIISLLVVFSCSGLDASTQTVDENQERNAKQLFQDFKNRLYQVRTIDNASGSKASIGSAFAVQPNGILATNYHVVSKYILASEKYSLEVLTDAQNTLKAEVLSIDVINDLALLKVSKQASLPVIEFATSIPEQGDSIFSLGNPRDLGMTVVPGTYNGTTAHSMYDRILFSGSINPGMSGGPVLNTAGQLVGINVATSGNQISFLVPLQKLQTLIEQHDQNHTVDFETQAATQLISNQQRLMSAILDTQWQTIALGDAEVIGEVNDFITCWGESDTRGKDLFQQVYRRCRNSEYIYMAPDFSTGIFEMEFYFYSSEKLTNWQFYRMLNDAFASVSAGNVASEDHVTEYQCHSDFVGTKNTKISKAVYCVRQYRQYPELYDVLFLSASTSHQLKSLVSHYTLSGVNQVNAQQFLTRFLEQVQ
ncbi:S1C family serine protease [Pleionea litopenaei]|uniref:Serine protease n=1 Tax=Pleionea litopenaei TaxID=3070815 RepID=A0AA51RTM8_9GAMM|nr:serine protease [Pleionea sp. HL-JVS1]WMS87377.1 serine protease [Pleionea sp. HL-JVS1]